MKIVITTGGTGGHIYPATALAEQLLQDDKTNEILFIGNISRMEAVEIPKLGYRFIGISAQQFNNNPKKMQALVTLYKSYNQCLKLLDEIKPDIVIGFGGYVTVPVVLAAVKLKIKTIIHEQNSIAGMANRMLSHFVDKVVICYKSASDAFNKNKTLLLGNPRESSALNFIKDHLIFKQFGLSTKKKTVLIVMGSLGSLTVNKQMMAIIESLKTKDYNVLYVTGNSHYEEFANNVAESNNVKIVKYINQFEIAGNCDLVISRGGATSAAEYMALGVPTIIIPSPYVPNNHQYLNAKAMLDNGAAILLEEKDLNPITTVELIDSLINDKEKLAQMSLQAKAMSHPNAAIDFVNLIKETVNNGNNRK